MQKTDKARHEASNRHIAVPFIALLLAALLAACISTATPGGPGAAAESSYSLADLTDDLRAAGLTVEAPDMEVDHGFAIKGRRVLVDGKPLFVYEFADAATAEAAAANVSVDAGSMTVTRTEGNLTIEVHGDMTEAPHLFKKGRLIAISGDNPGVLKVLEVLLGPQFAGG